jgi:hypothetical protein
MNLYLGSGHDIISAGETVTASVFFDGGQGRDSFVQDFSQRTDNLNLNINLQDFIPGGNGFSSVERINFMLGSGNDTMTLINPIVIPNSQVSIVGNGGNDRLNMAIKLLLLVAGRTVLPQVTGIV